MTNQVSKPEFYSIDLPVKYFNIPELLEFINLLGAEIAIIGTENITIKTENKEIISALTRLKAKRILENILFKTHN